MSPPAKRRQRPMPALDGWRPMEAAEALCPDAAAFYRQGGEALEAAINQDLHRMSARANRYPEIRPDAWLTLQLLDALRGRPDLRLTGRNPYDSLAPRTTVTPDVLRDACQRDNRDHATRRRWVQIDFRDGHVSSSHDLPPTHFNTAQPSSFADARIEASSASPAQPDPSAGGADTAGKPKYTPERCKEWLRWRVEDWPKDKPPPTAKECLAAARAHFSGDIPRDPFYELRATDVPKGWQKQGRRG
jgi:hypothetical protein